MLVVGANTLVKAVRDAVFLSQFGVTELSVLSIVLAAAMGFFVGAYLRVSQGASRERLISSTYGLIVVVLLALGVAIEAGVGPGWVPWALYVASSLFGLFIVMQAWMLIGDLFDLREAKRLFGVIGAGAIVGGAAGGGLARGLAGWVGPGALLFVAGVMLIGAMATSRAAWVAGRPEPAPRPAQPSSPRERRESSADLSSPQSSWKTTLETPLVRAIALGALLATVAATLLDWQVKAIAKLTFAGDQAAMVAFFGSLLAYLSIVSLVLQLTCTSWFLRRFGVGAGRAAMPVVLLVGSVLILVHGVLPWSLLAAAAGARVAEGGLRFALEKSSSELTWLPVHVLVRERAKTFVDTVVDRLGTGVAGVTWLVLVAFGLDQPDTLHWVGLVVAGFILLRIALLPTTHRAYVDALRATLARREFDLDNLGMGLGQAEFRRTVETALATGDAGQIRFALYLLSNTEDEIPGLSSALAHEDSAIRLETLALLSRRGAAEQRGAVLELVSDADLEVRERAVRFLRETAPPDGDDAIAASLSRSDQPELRFVGEIVEIGEEPSSDQLERLSAILDDAEPEDRRAMLRLVGAAPPAVARELLGPLLESDDDALVELALAAAGRAQVDALVPQMAKLLMRPRLRTKVVDALSAMRGDALEGLLELLPRRDVPIAARRAIIRLAGASREKALAARLVPYLNADEPDLAHAALRAVVRLRTTAQAEVPTDTVRPLLMEEARALHRDLLFLDRGSWPRARSPKEGEGLLERSVREATDSRVDRVFALLKLLFRPRDIQSVDRGVRSPVRRTRASSLELLDNLLSGELKGALLTALDDVDSERHGVDSRRALSMGIESRQDVLSRLMGGRPRWLASAAAWAAGVEGAAGLQDALRETAQSHDAPEVQAVARRALNHLENGAPMEATKELTIVEKVLKLQSVDVLERVTTEDLAFVAQIAEEIEVDEGAALYEDGDHPDALYIVIDGSVQLRSEGEEIGVIGAGEAFGSWALLDDSPRIATAAATSKARLLKVDRDEFTELLADRVEIVQAVFKAMVERIRSLASLV